MSASRDRRGYSSFGSRRAIGACGATVCGRAAPARRRARRPGSGRPLGGRRDRPAARSSCRSCASASPAASHVRPGCVRSALPSSSLFCPSEHPMDQTRSVERRHVDVEEHAVAVERKPRARASRSRAARRAAPPAALARFVGAVLARRLRARLPSCRSDSATLLCDRRRRRGAAARLRRRGRRPHITRRNEHDRNSSHDRALSRYFCGDTSRVVFARSRRCRTHFEPVVCSECAHVLLDLSRDPPCAARRCRASTCATRSASSLLLARSLSSMSAATSFRIAASAWRRVGTRPRREPCAGSCETPSPARCDAALHRRARRRVELRAVDAAPRRDGRRA